MCRPTVSGMRSRSGSRSRSRSSILAMSELAVPDPGFLDVTAGVRAEGALGIDHDKDGIRTARFLAGRNQPRKSPSDALTSPPSIGGDLRQTPDDRCASST